MRKIYAVSLLITAFAICLAIESCKKEDKPSDLILCKWHMTAYIHDGVDAYGTVVGTCITDNIATFSSNQQLVVDEGATKCDSSDPQAITGRYSLNTDNTQLTVSSSASSEVYNIQTLNSTTLKLEQISNGDIITYTKIP